MMTLMQIRPASWLKNEKKAKPLGCDCVILNRMGCIERVKLSII